MLHRSEPRTGWHCLEDQMTDSVFLESAEVGSHRWSGPSCPEESLTSPQDERLLMNLTKTPGFLASGGEEFNPGPETRLASSDLLCNKVLLKCKGDRESYWHRHQKWVERVPACLMLAMELYTLQSMSGGCKDLTKPTPIIYILR